MPISEEEQKKLNKIKREAEERAAKRMAEGFKLPYLNLSRTPIDMEALKMVDENISQRAEIVAFLKEERKMAVGLRRPQDAEALEIINGLEKKGFKINRFFVSDSSFKRAFDLYKKIPKKLKGITGEVEISKEKLEEFKANVKNTVGLKAIVDKYSMEKTTELAEVLLGAALSLDASDIHVEPEQEHTKIRYRIDGVLQDVTFLEPKAYNLILSRIKVLAELKLNIRDKAQDGRFSITSEGLEIEIRVSLLPSEYGETIVMRILNPKSLISIEELGMRPDLLALMEEEIDRPNGMVLITGPTGSGKTTTLYAYLKKINSPDEKIVTIEDPIEYHIEGISQTQVEPEKGYDFANGLRAIVRQDPDVILVGEIRDQETAEIACHAALTGHLVFSTLHTNDAVGAIPRLIDMGIQPAIIAPSINIAMAQRLVRRLCKECAKPVKISPDVKEKMEKILSILPESARKPIPEKIYEANGCEKCNNTGYKGRIAVYEVFKIDSDVEKLVVSYPSVSDLRDLGRKKGLSTMQEDALLRVLEGTTTIDEAERILGKIL